MAQKVQLELVDDLDGAEAAETVRFSLDGTVYEIDLSSENAAKLRKEFAPYVDHARKVSPGAISRRLGRRRSGGVRARSDEIRGWARQRGYKISERGRIPASIITEFESSRGSTSPSANEMVIDIYLDTDDERVAAAVFAAVNELAEIIGIEEMAPGEVLHGSIFKRTKAKMQASLSERAVQQRLQTIERAVELWQVDSRQSEVDQRTSQALSTMINSLQDSPQACIRFGSLLIVKYQDPSGPILLCQALSQPEILALEKYPELQSTPRAVFDGLALAMSREKESTGDEPEESI